MEIQVIKVESKSRKLNIRWSISEEIVVGIRHPPVGIMRLSREQDYAEANIWKRLFG